MMICTNTVYTTSQQTSSPVPYPVYLSQESSEHDETAKVTASRKMYVKKKAD